MLSRPVANPPNPWATTEVDYLGEAPDAKLEVYVDHTRQILARNDSPDLGFSYSVNPYRGCFHACAYCYARPTHEYLSFGAGTDFERKLVVKPEAPALLREAFEKRSWRGELVVMSGVTDCYQPLEASYRLTRGCLEVCAEYRNPVSIITKAPLVERDLDVLTRLAAVAEQADEWQRAVPVREMQRMRQRRDQRQFRAQRRMVAATYEVRQIRVAVFDHEILAQQPRQVRDADEIAAVSIHQRYRADRSAIAVAAAGADERVFELDVDLAGVAVAPRAAQR